MASKQNVTLYTGFTSDLVKRVYEHKTKVVKGFTSRYGVTNLVFYEIATDVHEAIKREKNIQSWKRSWKLRLIESKNPNWDDLYAEIAGCQPTLTSVQNVFLSLFLSHLSPDSDEKLGFADMNLHATNLSCQRRLASSRRAIFPGCQPSLA